MSCRAPLQGYLARHICAACGTPQPVAASADYFEALGVPERFRQDSALLEKRFYEISRALHPDRFAALPVTAEARLNSIQRMSFLNQAYQTLKAPGKLRDYLLKQHGIAGTQGTSSSARIPMELAESWFELQDALTEDPGEAQQRLREFEQGLHALKAKGDATLKSVEEEFDRAADAGQSVRQALEKLSKEIQSQSYLSSMERDIERIRGRLK